MATPTDLVQGEHPTHCDATECSILNISQHISYTELAKRETLAEDILTDKQLVWRRPA